MLAFSAVAVSRGYSLGAVCGLLIEVASLIAETNSRTHMGSAVVLRGLSSCNSWALEQRLNSGGTQA